MTTNSRTSRRLAAGSLAAAAVAVLAAANPAAGTSHSAYDAACSFDPAFLPRTADAAQGWYDQCPEQQRFATNSGLPSTPDAIVGWFIQRRTGQHIVTYTGPSSPEATETPTADRPANWRRLMDEVPESPQLLGRPAPLTHAEQDHQRVRAAFERGVGPGQSLYSR